MRSRRDHKTILSTVRKPVMSAALAVVEAVWTRDASQCTRPGCGRRLHRPGKAPDFRTTGYVYSRENPMTDPAKARLLCGPHFKALRP